MTYRLYGEDIMNTQEQINDLLAQVKELNEQLQKEKQIAFKEGKEDITHRFIKYSDSLCRSSVGFVNKIISYSENSIFCNVDKIYEDNISINCEDSVYCNDYKLIDRDYFMYEYERINRKIQSNR